WRHTAGEYPILHQGDERAGLYGAALRPAMVWGLLVLSDRPSRDAGLETRCANHTKPRLNPQCPCSKQSDLRNSVQQHLSEHGTSFECLHRQMRTPSMD